MLMHALPLLNFVAVVLAQPPSGTPLAEWPEPAELAWACEYHGNALPTESVPLWSASEGRDTDASLTDEGLRIVDTSAAQGSLRSFSRRWRVDPAAGGALEARVRVTANQGGAGVGFLLADGINEALLALFPDRVDVNAGAFTAAFDTTSGFHTYRLATRGADFAVWADGELLIDGAGGHTRPAHDNRSVVTFGALSSSAVADAVYAYVAYVPFGVPPLPERYAGIVEDVVVYREPGVYACFPYLYALEDGTLVASFGTRTRRSHIDPTGGSATYTSTDAGQSWSALEGARPTDPAIVRADGTLVTADAYGWRHVPSEREQEFKDKDITVRPVREGVVAYLQGAVVKRSADGGKTWDSQELTLPPHRSMMSYERVDARSLDPGLRVVAIYGELREDALTRAFLLRSDDDGGTWAFLPLAADPEGKARLNETALVQNAAGELVAMSRTEPPEGGYLHCTISKDRGLTWGPTVKTGIWGYPAHLLRLSDGRMVCAYGYRRDPMGIRAVISDDGGHTWDPEQELILRCDGGFNGSDLGYPMSIETSPGRVCTVYYMTTDDGVTHIAATLWDVPGHNAE